MFKKYWLFALVSLGIFAASLFVLFELAKTDKIGDIAFSTVFISVLCYSFALLAIPKLKEVDFVDKEFILGDEDED